MIGFGGLPHAGPDAAISFGNRIDGKTYFITNDQLYRLNDKKASMMSGYPTTVGNELIHCRQAGRQAGQSRDQTSGNNLVAAIARIFKLMHQKETKADRRHSGSE